MMCGVRLFVLLLLLCHSSICFGQSTVSLSINERFQFVLSENDEALAGLDIQSPSGSLLPGEAAASGPFTFALSQSQRQVSFGNLGTVTQLAEPTTLPAGWNPAGLPDVWFQYGVSGSTEAIGPLFLFDDKQIAPDPDISVTLNEESKFVLSGSGEQLIGISFQSESGSLVPGPAGDSGPFSLVYQNDSRQLSYGQISSEQPLVLDGSLTLPGGWSQLGVNDIQYHYNQVGPIHSGPQTLALGDQRAPVQVSLDDEFRFVLQGSAELEQVRIASPSGSLLPSSSTAPFQELNSNTSESIVYSTNQPVSIDGTLTLDARWNRNLGIQDVEFGYSGTGGGLVADTALPGAFYPTRVVSEPIRVRVDDASDITLRGSGQELRSIQLDSPTGWLRAEPTDTGPFSNYVSLEGTRVTLESSEFVTIDGTIALPVRYLLGSGQRDLSFRYSQVGIENLQGPFDATYSFRAEPIGAGIDFDLGFWVQGSGDPLREINFRSPSGSLVPGDDPAPFEQFESNTSEHVSLLGDVLLDGRLKLNLGWDETAADVLFSYALQGSETEFGPFGVRYPSPNEVLVIAAPFVTDRLTLVGEDQIITLIEITSESGSLQLLEAIDPDTGLLPGSSFEIVESFTPERVLLRSVEGVLVDDIDLPLSWDQNGEADLQATFEGLGDRAIIPRFNFISNIFIPEPNADVLLLSVLPLILLLRRRR